MKSPYLEFLVGKMREYVTANDMPKYEEFEREYCNIIEGMKARAGGHHDPDLLDVRKQFLLVHNDAVRQFYTKRKV